MDNKKWLKEIAPELETKGFAVITFDELKIL